jgi:beta-fructofuranosidase
LKTGELDLGAFYAPKTQLDAQGRRILWGWIPERRSDAAMKAAGWSGMMSLPRVMNLDQDGTLRLRFLPQASVLRAGPVVPAESRSGQLKILRQASGEVMCAGTPGKSFDLSLATDVTELLRVSYTAEKHSFVADGKEVSLQPSDPPALHLFVDGSVIEMIVSERIGYTKRFYYDGATAPDVRAWAISSGGGVQLNAWKISPISPNRLTTPAQGD